MSAQRDDRLVQLAVRVGGFFLQAQDLPPTHSIDSRFVLDSSLRYVSSPIWTWESSTDSHGFVALQNTLSIVFARHQSQPLSNANENPRSIRPLDAGQDRGQHDARPADASTALDTLPRRKKKNSGSQSAKARASVFHFVLCGYTREPQFKFPAQRNTAHERLLLFKASVGVPIENDSTPQRNVATAAPPICEIGGEFRSAGSSEHDRYVQIILETRPRYESRTKHESKALEKESPFDVARMGRSSEHVLERSDRHRKDHSRDTPTQRERERESFFSFGKSRVVKKVAPPPNAVGVEIARACRLVSRAVGIPLDFREVRRVASTRAL